MSVRWLLNLPGWNFTNNLLEATRTDQLVHYALDIVRTLLNDTLPTVCK